MARKLYKSLTEYRRCFTEEEEKQAEKEGFKDISNFLNVTPEPVFTEPDPIPIVEDIIEEDEETLSEEEHAQNFMELYKGKKAYRGGKPTKAFKQYLEKHEG